MEYICSGNNNVIRLLNNKRDKKLKYRLSDRCILFRDSPQDTENDIRILKNTLTGQIIMLSQAEFDALSGMKNKELSLDDAEENGLGELIENGCIVPTARNEYESYLSLLKILRMMRKPSGGYENYIIFPTTGCNARCVYCFENDYVPQTMTRETAMETAGFIIRTKGKEPIHLKWFGGEPLAAASRIDEICEELRKHQVDFKSSIVTNATLLVPEIVERANSLWHLKKAQVSLDGYRNDYETRKRYVNPAKHHYEAAMNGISLLLEAGIEVDLRCNYDEENLTGLPGFLRDIQTRFGENPGMRLYFTPLYQELERGNAHHLIYRIREIEDEAEALGIHTRRGKHKSGLSLNFCMADDMERSIVIDPEGYLQFCEHLSEGNRFGNVRDGITDQKRYEALRTVGNAEKECEGCAFLPECTPFFRKGCPMGVYPNCREVKLAKTENSLHRIAAAHND